MSTNYAIYFDSSKCIACRSCQVSCKQWNDREAEITENRGSYENPAHLSSQTWLRITFREGTKQNNDPFWFFGRNSCLHCTDAPCVSVCPTGAMAHVNNNYVVVDTDWCIGCRYCVQACPYEVPRFNEKLGVVEKCTFCVDRVQNGYQPACVKSCPDSALEFGDRDKMIGKAKARIAKLKGQGFSKARIYGDKELSGQHVINILLDEPEAYGMPSKPKGTGTQIATDWGSGVAAAAVMATLPIAWAVNRRMNAKKEEK